MLYQDIPKKFREYLSVNRRQFNRLPDAAQDILFENARKRYNENHVEEISDMEEEDFPEDKFVMQVSERICYTGRNRKWSNLCVTGTSKTTVYITPSNIVSFGEYMDRMKKRYLKRGFKPYQYTLSAGDKCINSLPSSTHLLSKIEMKLEEYEKEGFSLDSYVIRYKKGYNRRYHHGNIRAGNGQGVPTYLNNGFWELDIFQTKTKCIHNSYTLWKLYRKNKLDDVLKGDHDKFIKKRNELPTEVKARFNDIVNLDKDDFNILYDVDDIGEINPSDTMEVCWFIYYNNHVGLLIHENYISKESINILHKMSKRTVTNKIRTKKKLTNLVNIVAADIESYRRPNVYVDTDNKERYLHVHEPLLIGQYTSGGKFIHFRGEDALDPYCKYLVDEEKDWLIWFHNGGKYDTHFLIEPITKYCNIILDEPVEIRDLNGKFIEVKCYLKNGHLVTFRDSVSILPGKLSTIAEDMGVSLKMEDVDIKNVSREDILQSQKILDYNRDDCKALYEILEKYQKIAMKNFKTNPLQQVSGSSYAKRVFFSTYYDEDKYPLYALTKHTHDFISQGYGGGRNEVLRRGRFTKLPIFPYDFTSFYPAVGRLPLPYGVPKYVDGLEKIRNEDMDKYLKEYPGFYRVTILSSPRDKHPLHGVYHDHRYVFPHFENYEGLTIFSEELRLGLANGYKYKLICGYTQELAPICAKFFERMIKEKTKAKAEGHTAMEFAYKIIANAGYGYFGFNPYDRTVMKVYGQDMEEHLESLADNGQLSYRKEGDVYLCYETTNVLLPDINVAVAAAITSYARMRLWELIQDILDTDNYDDLDKNGKPKKGIVYYYDTDSVHCSIDIEKHKTLRAKWCGPGNGKNLGELKRELNSGNSEVVAENIVDAVYIGCKVYGYRTNKDRYCVKSKGTNNPEPMKKLEHEVKDKDLYKWLKNKDKCTKMFKKLCKLLTSPQFFKTENIVTSRVHKIKEDMEVYDKTIMKKIEGIYTKGIVMDNGVIKPLVLSTKHITNIKNDDDNYRIPLYLTCDKEPDDYISEDEDDDDYNIPLHLTCDKDPDDYISDSYNEEYTIISDDKYPKDYDSDIQYENELDW